MARWLQGPAIEIVPSACSKSCVRHGEATLVPGGGDLYSLNDMAGPVRTWKFHNEPAHEWLGKG